MSRIIVACKSNAEYVNVCNAISKSDYSVFARATSSFELQNFVKVNDPDAVVIVGKIDNSVNFIDTIIEFNNCPVIVVDSEIQKANYYNFLGRSMFQFIEDVSYDSSLNIVLEMLIKSSKEMGKLNQQVVKLEEKNKTMMLVNQAKFFLVETKGLSEMEAHKLINTLSMKHRQTKATIAKKILDKK